MKYVIALFCLFSVILVSNAQVDTTGASEEFAKVADQEIEIDVVSASVRAPKEYIPGVYVEVTATVETFAQFWKNFAKKEYSVKFKDKKGVLLAKSVHIPEITHQEIDVYTSIGVENEVTRFNMGVVFSSGQYIDSADYPDNFNRLKAFVEKTSKRYYTDYYNTLLEKLQAQNASLLKSKEKLVGRKNRLENDILQERSTITAAEKTIIKSQRYIEKSQTKINQNKQKIELLTLQQEEQEQEAEAKQSEIDATDSLALKQTLVGEKEKIEKAITKTQKGLAKAESSTVKEKSKITTNEATIRMSNDEIVTANDKIKQAESEIATLNTDISEKDKQLEIKEGHIDKIKSKMTQFY